MDGKAGNTEELSAFVQQLLSQMHTRFDSMSGTILGRIDELGAQLDALERAVGDLAVAAETHGAPADAAPPR